MSVHVSPERPFTGNAAEDAPLLIRAIRSGHAYTALDSTAAPPAFELSGTNNRGTARAGDELMAGGPISLRVRSNARPEFTTIVWNGANVLSPDHHEQDFTVMAPEGAGVYWVEVRSQRSPAVAWLISNPIYVRDAGSPAQLPVRPAAVTSQVIF